jgi:outer membrane protein insertion porin family
VSEGIRYRWGEIKIEGVTVFSKKEILDIGGFVQGDVADGKALQDFVYDRLKDAYGEKGYVQYNAEFDPNVVKPSVEDGDGTVDVLITIDEGRKYSVRRIIYKGIPLSEEEALRRGFDLREGDVFVQRKLKASIERINEAELYYHIDPDRDVEILANDESADVDVVINVKKRSDD